MQPTALATATMVKAVRFSEDWSEQRVMLDELKDRNDLFNIEPILDVALDTRQHYSVRRAAIECAATHNESLTLDRMRRTARDRWAEEGERKLALEALAAMQLPSQTLPILEQVAAGHGPQEVRSEAISLIGKYRNLRSVGTLVLLARGRDRGIAAAAEAALDHLVEANGGRRAVTTRMIQRARDLRQRGHQEVARRILQAASWLEPHNGKILYEAARLAAA